MGAANPRRSGSTTVGTKARERPLWKCPKCGKRFVTPNMWHSCGRYTVAQFFKGASPEAKALYRAFVDFVRHCGPFTIEATKSRVAFQGRVRFAGVTSVGKDALVIGFWLKRRIDSPRFARVENPMPRDWIYRLKISDTRELDAELLGWLREAYAVGQQERATVKA